MDEYEFGMQSGLCIPLVYLIPSGSLPADTVARLPAHLREDPARAEVLRFISAFKRLRAVERSALCEIVMSNVMDGYMLKGKSDLARGKPKVRKALGLSC